MWSIARGPSPLSGALHIWIARHLRLQRRKHPRSRQARSRREARLLQRPICRRRKSKQADSATRTELKRKASLAKQATLLSLARSICPLAKVPEPEPAAPVALREPFKAQGSGASLLPAMAEIATVDPNAPYIKADSVTSMEQPKPRLPRSISIPDRRRFRSKSCLNLSPTTPRKPGK